MTNTSIVLLEPKQQRLKAMRSPFGEHTWSLSMGPKSSNAPPVDVSTAVATDGWAFSDSLPDL
jgi:hypothetical protein